MAVQSQQRGNRKHGGRGRLQNPVIDIKGPERLSIPSAPLTNTCARDRYAIAFGALNPAFQQMGRGSIAGYLIRFALIEIIPHLEKINHIHHAGKLLGNRWMVPAGWLHQANKRIWRREIRAFRARARIRRRPRSAPTRPIMLTGPVRDRKTTSCRQMANENINGPSICSRVTKAFQLGTLVMRFNSQAFDVDESKSQR